MGKGNSKYIFLRLSERNGEYEYYHRKVLMLHEPKDQTAERMIKKYVKEFYGTKAVPEDGGYYFHRGEVFVEVDGWQFISEDEFYTLTKYL